MAAHGIAADHGGGQPVETKEQDTFLCRRECDELQGSLFSKPVPADQIPSLLMPRILSPSIQTRRAVERLRSEA
jgi:hypothetical protein